MILPEKNNILITGVVRNVEKCIERNIEKIYNASKDFNKVYFYLSESDSSDKTIQKLEELKIKYPNFEYKTSGNLRLQFNSRTERIAYCRNICVNYVRELEKKIDNLYVMVVDLDNNINISRSDIRQSLGIDFNWDVFTAIQSDYYYDIYALRHETWSNSDCWEHFRFLRYQLGYRYLKAYHIAIRSKQIRTKRIRKPIRVTSAFNGLAIYKPKTYTISLYKGKKDDGTDVCEHVPFHEKLCKAGKCIIINPFLIIGKAPKQHYPNYILLLLKSFYVEFKSIIENSKL